MVTSSEVGKTVSTRPGRAGCWLQRLAAARCVGSRGRLDGRETRQFVELRRCLGRSATSARPRPSSPTRTKAVAHGANGEVVLGIGRTGLRRRPTQTQAKHFERDGGSGAPTWRPQVHQQKLLCSDSLGDLSERGDLQTTRLNPPHEHVGWGQKKAEGTKTWPTCSTASASSRTPCACVHLQLCG